MVEAATKQENVPEQPQVAVKKLKKKWIPILTTQDFNNTYLGETYVDEADKALGKSVEANLMNLTHDPKKQNMVVTFTVTEVKNGQANGILTGYEIPPAHVKRLTKRSKAKIEDSFEYTTADNVKMQIKPVIMTRSQTHKSKLTLMRLESRKFLAEIVKKESFVQVMKDVIAGNLQRDLKNEIKKYHAVSGIMIRVAKKMPHQ